MTAAASNSAGLKQAETADGSSEVTPSGPVAARQKDGSEAAPDRRAGKKVADPEDATVGNTAPAASGFSTLIRDSYSATLKALHKLPETVTASRLSVACDGNGAWLEQRASNSSSPVVAAF